MADQRQDTYDIVILGGGSGGYACALRAAELGLSVALVERSKLGGTCLHLGCIPTKALLHAAEVADSARESAQFGVRATFESIDLPAVHAYKDGVVNRLHKGLQGLVKAADLTYVEGTGRVVAADAVEVGGEGTLVGVVVDRGVVDEDVEPLGPRRERRDVLRVVDVEARGPHVPVVRQFRRDRRGPLLVPRPEPVAEATQ